MQWACLSANVRRALQDVNKRTTVPILLDGLMATALPKQHLIHVAAACHSMASVAVIDLAW